MRTKIATIALLAAFALGGMAQAQNATKTMDVIDAVRISSLAFAVLLPAANPLVKKGPRVRFAQFRHPGVTRSPPSWLAVCNINSLSGKNA